MPKKWPKEPAPAQPPIGVDVWLCHDCRRHGDTTYQVTDHTPASTFGAERYLRCPMCMGRIGCPVEAGPLSLHVFAGYRAGTVKQ